MSKATGRNIGINKIIPRNLTARASQSVLGNPPISRPESVVANCFPGLEVDHRNLEQHFLSGWTFEYQRTDGSLVSNIDESIKTELGLTATDYSTSNPLYLWALCGRFKASDAVPVVVGLIGLSGLDIWRRVHDLLPGSVAVIVGPGPGLGSDLDPTSASDELKLMLDTATNSSKGVVRRASNQDLRYVVVSGKRAPYLDQDGVIDVETYGPGELSKSLCSPWIYDFRDCYCFFWAASKPDIVASADGTQLFANFLRKDRGVTPTPQDVTQYVGRSDGELTYLDLAKGLWEELPFVVNDRELGPLTPNQVPETGDLLNRAEAIAELRYLATVEVALATQYLYAHYMLRTSESQPSEIEARASVAIDHCAAQLLNIAVDEMRHFHWVNDILKALGDCPSTGRADVLGASPTGTDGRKLFPGKEYLNEPFTLDPLTERRLQWFIDVEAPSRVFGEKLDGMYCQLLASVEKLPDEFHEHDTVAPLLKLLIDEGDGHYDHLIAIQKSLADVPRKIYLRYPRKPKSERERVLLDLADLYYEMILATLHVAFLLPADLQSGLLYSSRRVMESLNDVAQVLAASDIAVRFKKPSGLEGSLAQLGEKAELSFQKRGIRVRSLLSKLKHVGTKGDTSLIMRLSERHALILASVTTSFPK